MVRQVILERKHTHLYYKYYFAFSMGLPLLLLIIALATDSLGYDMQSPWCHIGGPYAPANIAYFLFYGPILAVSACCACQRR